jgi:hypothetical protein
MVNLPEFAAAELGVTFYPGQADVLRGYEQSGRPHLLFLSGRRGGKSLCADCLAIADAVLPDYSDVLRPGEERHVLIVSVRADSAQLHIKQIGKLMRGNRQLKKLIVEESKDRLVLRNGVTILSLPASARAGRGYTASMVLFDELSHFQDSDGNASGDVVLEAFAPVVATFGERGKLVVTTTPAARSGVVFDIFERASAGELDDWFVAQRSTAELNPKVSAKTIANAFKRDPESAEAEYNAQFREPVESFLSGAAIDAAVDRGPLGLMPRQSSDVPKAGVQYVMAVDPAVVQDRYGYLIAHADGGKIIVDYCKLLFPPINPADAETLLRDLARKFSPTVIRTDSAALVQRLGRELPALRYEPFTRPRKLQWYGAIKESLNLNNLSLPKHDDLLAELRALQIRNGVDIGHPKSGSVRHDDLADCLALAADALVARMGSALYSMPNFFYGDFDGYFEAGLGLYRPQGSNEYTWVVDETVENRHELSRAAVDACKFRNRGCASCADFFQPQVEAERLAMENVFPMSEEEADLGILEAIGRGPDRQAMIQREIANEHRTKQVFRSAVRRELARDRGGNQGGG